MTNENLLAENLKTAFGDAFVGARPYGGRAYICFDHVICITDFNWTVVTGSLYIGNSSMEND